MKRERSPETREHRPPTRRAFVAMIGAAAAAFALRDHEQPVTAEVPPSQWTGRTRWIGHC